MIELSPSLGAFRSKMIEYKTAAKIVKFLKKLDKLEQTSLHLDLSKSSGNVLIARQTFMENLIAGRREWANIPNVLREM